MKIKEFFELVSTILKDWHVIVTVVVMIFVMWTANVIITYKKKPRKTKKNKAPKPAPPKPAEEKKEENSEAESKDKE